MDTTARDTGEVVTDVVETPPTSASASKLRWSAIFGGTFAALGMWVLLAAFGLAVGLKSITPEDASLRGPGTWLGIWSLIVPILALAFGTFVAARAAVVAQRSTGLLYGVVVWGLTTFVGTLMLVSLTTSAIGRTVGLAGRVASGLGSAAVSAIGGAAGTGGEAARAVANWLDIGREDLVASVNQRLAAEGKPPIRPEQIQAALQDAANTALRQGGLSQEILVAALERHTRLSRQDVEEAADTLMAQWNATTGRVTQQLQQAAGSARAAALAALNRLGDAFWFLFFSTLLGLGAALAAGLLVTTWRVRRPITPERVRAPRLEEAPAGA